ncbi:Hypothetical protein ABZS17H1_04071 [Kosakonia cowanii]
MLKRIDDSPAEFTAGTPPKQGADRGSFFFFHPGAINT